jgi:hypothetical protein
MKKLAVGIIIFGLILSFVSFVKAQPGYINYRGPVNSHRVEIDNDGGALPSSTSDAVNFADPEKYSHIAVYCEVIGAGNWRISPFLRTTGVSEFFESSGDKASGVTSNYIFVVPIDGADYVYMQCDNAGSGYLEVSLQGVNRY